MSVKSIGFRFRNHVVGDSLSDIEMALWILVLVSMTGDIVTTFIGLHLGLSESNPIARVVIETLGVFGMVLMKTVAIAIAFGCRRLLPYSYRPIIPACLAIPWTLAVGINVFMIATI